MTTSMYMLPDMVNPVRVRSLLCTLSLLIPEVSPPCATASQVPDPFRP